MHPTLYSPPTLSLESIQPRLRSFAKKHSEITRLVVFGSVSRGDAHENSDVDVLVDFTPNHARIGMAAFAYLDDLENELSAELSRQVHLIEWAAVDSARRIGNRSLAEAVARDGKTVYELEPAAA